MTLSTTHCESQRDVDGRQQYPLVLQGSTLYPIGLAMVAGGTLAAWRALMDGPDARRVFSTPAALLGKRKSGSAHADGLSFDPPAGRPALIEQNWYSRFRMRYPFMVVPDQRFSLHKISAVS
jgi:hypothetical protein